MEKIIIGLVGKNKAGKTTAAKYLQEKYGAFYLRFSRPLQNILERCHLPVTRENLQELSTILRVQFGEDLLAKIIFEDVNSNQSEIFVIDGVRRLADIKYLKNLPGFVLVSIECDTEIRWNRMRKQNDKVGDKNKTFKQFLKEENQESESQISKVMRVANMTINNTQMTKEEHLEIWDKFMLIIKDKLS